MKQFALAFALLFVAAPAIGVEPFPRYGNDLDRGYRVPMEIDRLAALLGDEVLRDMVCRLAHERYAFGNLSSALGVPEGQVMRRINTLRGWGLVRTVSGDHTIVEPLPGDGAQTLRRWANRYCSEGDACGVPTTNPDTQKSEKEKETAASGAAPQVSAGGAAPQVGGESAAGEKSKSKRGTVKWFDPGRGYGFIEPEDHSRDVYVHKSAVERSGLSGLREGQKVTYDLVPGRGGKMAAENLASAD